jgi:hypothetical protein
VKKLFFSLIVSLGLILSACSSPAPATTAAPGPTEAAEQPTATLEPTEAPEPTDLPPTNTPESTATPEPIAQPISGANAANLTFQELVELPRRPQLAFPYVLFTPDSQSVIVQTEAGADLLNADNLEVENGFPGVQAAGFLADGRLYGKQNGGLVFVDLGSGEIETAAYEGALSTIYAISPQADKLAYRADDSTIRVIDIASGSATPIAIDQPLSMKQLLFSGDGEVLLAWWDLNYPNAFYAGYDTATGKQIYRQSIHLRVPQLSTDGQTAYFMQNSAVDAHNVADNSPTSTFPGVTEIGGEKMWLDGFFIAGSGELIVATYGGNSDNAYYMASDFATAQSSAVLTLSTHSRPVVAVAPDGSRFLILGENGGLTSYDAASGEVAAESEAYSLVSQPALSPDGSLVAWSSFEDVNVYNWQTEEFVLQASQPSAPWAIGRVGFLRNDSLFSENIIGIINQYDRPEQLPRLSIWDLSSGQMSNSYDSLLGCDSPDGVLYLKCALYKVNGNLISNTALRIFDLADVNSILATDNTESQYFISSPTGNGFASCNVGGNAITVRMTGAAAAQLPFACQPFIFGPEGTTLYLQDGTVVDLASGEASLQLEADASGHVFEASLTESMIFFNPNLQVEDIIDKPAKLFEGDNFIVIDNRVFDAAGGELLIELPDVTTVHGITLADDGMTLVLLTNRGLERWKAVQ